jgi:hypothetical protein
VNRNVSLPVALIALIALAAGIYVVYAKYANPGPIAHPGASDIPPRRPGDDKPVQPPPDAGPVPGAIKR